MSLTNEDEELLEVIGRIEDELDRNIILSYFKNKELEKIAELKKRIQRVEEDLKRYNEPLDYEKVEYLIDKVFGEKVKK